MTNEKNLGWNNKRLRALGLVELIQQLTSFFLIVLQILWYNSLKSTKQKIDENTMDAKSARNKFFNSQLEKSNKKSERERDKTREKWGGEGGRVYKSER